MKEQRKAGVTAIRWKKSPESEKAKMWHKKDYKEKKKTKGNKREKGIILPRKFGGNQIDKNGKFDFEANTYGRNYTGRDKRLMTKIL